MNTFALVAVLAVVCTAVTAFSENFFDEEALYNEEPVLSRVARHGGGGHGGKGNKEVMELMKECCCGKKCGGNSEEEMNEMKECFQNAEGEGKEKMCAGLTCIAKKKGLLKEDGTIDIDKACGLIKEKYDEDLHSEIEKHCNEVKEKLSEKAKKCPAAVIKHLGMHVMFKIEMNCPEGSKVESEKCEKKRNMMKQMAEHHKNKGNKGGH